MRSAARKWAEGADVNHEDIREEDMCVECEVRPAVWQCDQCNEAFCKQCYVSLHRTGRRAAHTYSMYKAAARRQDRLHRSPAGLLG